MGSPVTIARGFNGLNNTVDPARLPVNQDTGVIDLSEAVNISFDKTGRPGRRDGFTLRHGGNFHSLFTRGAIGYVGLDDAVYRINQDLSITGVRSGMSGKTIAYLWTPLGVYYSNGPERGFLEGDASRAWVKSDIVRDDSTRTYTGPPENISHMDLFLSSLFAAVGNTLWKSQPNDYGLFRRGADYNVFPSRIRMVRAVAGGMYISDETRTYFVSGKKPSEFQRTVVMESPAMEWSDMHDLVKPSDIGMEGSSPFAVWASERGLTYGSPDGLIHNPTEKMIAVPSGFNRGAVVMKDKNFIYNLHQ